MFDRKVTMAKEINRGEWDYPDTPELRARDTKEFEEWKKTRNAGNIDNRMCYNDNGYDYDCFNPSHSPETYTEKEIVHKFALSQVGNKTGVEAWTVYLSIAQAYDRYVLTGAKPSRTFDPTVLIQS